jgi:hypothetical protein
MASKENYDEAVPDPLRRVAREQRLTRPDWFVDSAEGTWIKELEAEVPVDAAPGEVTAREEPKVAGAEGD